MQIVCGNACPLCTFSERASPSGPRNAARKTILVAVAGTHLKNKNKNRKYCVYCYVYCSKHDGLTLR